MVLLQDDLWNRLSDELGGAMQSALQSCELLLCSLFPTISGPCDTQDFSSGTERLPTGEHAIFLYDMVYDGADLTRMAFDNIDPLISKSLERVETCACPTDEGCIRCIANPLFDQPASKTATCAMLRAIQTILQNEAPTVRHSSEDWTSRLEPESVRQCPSCDAEGSFRSAVLLKLWCENGGRVDASNNLPREHFAGEELPVCPDSR